jgi:Transposase IS116/IS110/IS902 family
VPSEHSSGASVKRGGLTKAGNSAARRLLIEAAWCYRLPARVSRDLLLRQEELPKTIRDIAWEGQVRLCARYRKLARTGKPANVVTKSWEVRYVFQWYRSSGIKRYYAEEVGSRYSDCLRGHRNSGTGGPYCGDLVKPVGPPSWPSTA